MLIEAVLTLVIVFLVLLMFGIPLNTLIGLFLIGISGLLILAVVLFILFFLITGISLLFFKKTKGVFVRFDDGRYERAVYTVDETEYTCIFPAENIARRSIYQKNSEHTLLISRFRKRKTAFDRHSLFIIALGTAFSVIMLILGILFLPGLFRIL